MAGYDAGSTVGDAIARGASWLHRAIPNAPVISQINDGANTIENFTRGLFQAAPKNAAATAPAATAPAATAPTATIDPAKLGASILAKAPIYAPDGLHGLPAVLQAGVDSGQSPAEAAAAYHAMQHPGVQKALAAAAPAASEFGNVAERFAAANGGQMNFAQLGALSDAYAKTTKAVPKAQTEKDKLIPQAAAAVANVFQADLADAHAESDPAKAAAKLMAAGKTYSANMAALAGGGSQVNAAVGDTINGSE